MRVATDRQPAGALALCGRARACVAGLMAVILASGCATFPDPQRANLVSESPPVRSCAAWFDTLDRVVDEAGVRDAGAYRVPGFPYLRLDRFLGSFRDRAAAGGDAFGEWIEHMRYLDATARGYELRNLPESRLRDLGVAERAQALARSKACAAELAHHDLASPAVRMSLIERAAVPDDYSDWQRGLGLYALARIPFAAGIERWQEEALAMFRDTREGTGPVRSYRRYGPPATITVAPHEAAAMLGGVVTDSLGIPRITRAERFRLLAAFAPIFEIDTTGTYDRFGALAWGGSATPGVDASRPTVYGRIAFTRYGERTLAQLVYSIWFSERPHVGPFDLLAGKLDGVVLRVTLSPAGEPLVYDSIHPCGCFHLFFPTALARPKPPPSADEEWAFIPETVPAMGRAQRLAVRVASRTHYLLAVAPALADQADQSYVIADEDDLRSLPAGESAWRSAFGPDGLVPGTERGERLLFWPMGIASAGAMRQWGRHATAFLGRRHFDDADLIERRFLILPR